jgi:hypothetical protein
MLNEAAKLLTIGLRTLRRRIDLGFIATVRIGARAVV